MKPRRLRLAIHYANAKDWYLLYLLCCAQFFYYRGRAQYGRKRASAEART